MVLFCRGWKPIRVFVWIHFFYFADDFKVGEIGCLLPRHYLGIIAGAHYGNESSMIGNLANIGNDAAVDWVGWMVGDIGNVVVVEL